jgi:PadR family transcriptional regulator, regulatory protein PadR
VSGDPKVLGTAVIRPFDIGLILCKIPFVVHHRIGPLPRKEQLILELLASEGPMYGLQIVEHSDGALKRGTVYVTLGRMEAKGLVESEQQPLPPDGIGLPRRIYRPTALGGRMLRAWTAFARELAWEMKP